MGTTWDNMWRPHGDNMGDNMETTWDVGTTGMWRPHVGTTWRQHGDNVGTTGMWRPHGDHMETTWGQHEDNVETTWGQHVGPRGCADHMGTTWGDNMGTT